jgi:hypothetical protein
MLHRHDHPRRPRLQASQRHGMHRAGRPPLWCGRHRRAVVVAAAAAVDSASSSAAAAGACVAGADLQGRWRRPHLGAVCAVAARPVDQPWQRLQPQLDQLAQGGVERRCVQPGFLLLCRNCRRCHGLCRAVPAILPNGTAFLMFRSHTAERLGLLRAETWRGPFVDWLSRPLVGESNEDPFMCVRH